MKKKVEKETIEVFKNRVSQIPLHLITASITFFRLTCLVLFEALPVFGHKFNARGNYEIFFLRHSNFLGV